MTDRVRPLDDHDAEASRQLRHEAFGSRVRDCPAHVPRLGQHWLGAYDGTRLVGRIADREYESWFGGALLPTSGMAGLTIAAESRGTPGLLDEMMLANMRSARERGAVVSTMFPTAQGIYRRHGFGRITELQTISVTMPTLATVKRPDGISLRRATADDFPAIRACYDTWARQHNGPLARTGAHFSSSGERFLRAFTAVTVAEDADGVCAYAAWDRSAGHTADSYIAVTDLQWTRPGGAAALLAMVATNAPVTGFLKLDTSANDPLRLVIGANQWDVLTSDVYALKLLDVVGAFERRTWDPTLRCTLAFCLGDDLLAENEGGYVVEIADGAAQVSRRDAADAVEISSRGLAIAWAGAHTATELAALGLLRGDAAQLTTWSLALGGRPVAIRDYF